MSTVITLDPPYEKSGSVTPTIGTSPSALSVSNDAKYLFEAEKGGDEICYLSINSDGSLTFANCATVGLAPTSVTTIGTYK